MNDPKAQYFFSNPGAPVNGPDPVDQAGAAVGPDGADLTAGPSNGGGAPSADGAQPPSGDRAESGVVGSVETRPSASLVPSSEGDRALARPTDEQAVAPVVDPEEWVELDELGAAAVQSIEDRDTPDARAELALGYCAQLTGDIHVFEGLQKPLGGPDHIDGITRTGWTPWGGFFTVASYVLMGIDALLWFLCGSRALVRTLWVVLILIAILLAFAGKSAGKYLATVHLVDPTSGKQTVAAHIRVLKRTIIPIIATALLAVVMFFTPLTLAPVIIALGWIPLIALNCLIGYTAGLCASLGEILLRPHKHGELDYEIQRRLRLREILTRYIPKKALKVIVIGVGLAVAGSTAMAATPDACGVFVDETRSLDAFGRERAVEFVLGSLLEYVSASKCTWVVAGKFAGEGRFESKTWIEVPSSLRRGTCEDAEPERLTGHAGLLDHIRTITEYRKGQAVEACERGREAFRTRVRAALAVVPRSGPTRLTGFLGDVLESGLYRAIVVVSDGIDMPSAPSRAIAVPKGVSVTLIIVRPDSQYATLEQALARAREWAAVPGVRVVTTGELRPRLWGEQVGGGR